MTNRSPLSYTGRVLAAAKQIGDLEPDTNDFSISQQGVLSLNNAAAITASTITATGDITTSGGDLRITGAAQQLQVEGGAVTDFIGTATLVAGTVTVANTNIAAADRIFVTRIGVNGSTAIGLLDVSISAGASFTITALEAATPANTETNDVSTVNYFIVRQL
jgi:hypothetical protein